MDDTDRLVAASLKLSDAFIPKLNIGDSALDAEAVAAWNEFEMAVAAVKRTAA